MDGTNSYLVRVINLSGASGSSTWELCRGDGLLVLQRSPRTFPTRVEALFDSAQYATILEFGAMPASSSSRAFP